MKNVKDAFSFYGLDPDKDVSAAARATLKNIVLTVEEGKIGGALRVLSAKNIRMSRVSSCRPRLVCLHTKS